MLNRFPYSSGHLMIAPNVHVSRLTAISEEASAEMMRLARASETILAEVYQPHGINLGMNMGLMPVTGIPLPLISYGGSSLVVLLALQGIVQSVAIRRRKLTF